MTILEHALNYAAAGIAIFPCRPSDKGPLVEHGFKAATPDADQIKRWWQEFPKALIGAPTGSKNKFVVLDLDLKKGKNGLAAVPNWKSLSALIVKTPSGGYHLYFRDDSTIGCTTSKIADGVDTRGEGGYVCLPGSGGYQWANGHDLITELQVGLPEWPAHLRPPARVERARDLTPLCELDLPENVERATQWVEDDRDRCAPVVEDGRRNSILANVVAHVLGDYGLSREGALDLALRWNEIKAIPPLDVEEVEIAVNSAFNGRKLPLGCLCAVGEFEAIETEGLAVLDAGRDIGDLTQLPPREYLLATVFCKKNISGLVGAGASGKTSLRILQYISLASGRALSSEHVFKRSRVLFLSFEDDVVELKRRIGVAMKYHSVSYYEVAGWLLFAALSRKDGKVAILDAQGRVIPGKLVKNLAHLIKEKRIDLIGFDPFVKSHSVTENDNKAMDAVMEILTDLAITQNIASDVVAHANKSLKEPGDADRLRGAGAQKDAARLLYTLTTMSREEAKLFSVPEVERELHVRFDRAKVNLGRPEAARWFKLVGVRLGNCNVDPAYPHGDEVQVATPWSPPELWADMPEANVDAILDEIDAGLPNGRRYSDTPSAKERAAWPVVIKHLPDKNEAQARKIVADWVKAGVLVSESYWDATDRKFALGLRVDASKRRTVTAQ